MSDCPFPSSLTITDKKRKVWSHFRAGQKESRWLVEDQPFGSFKSYEGNEVLFIFFIISCRIFTHLATLFHLAMLQ
jgi:hypothetical protein